MHRAFSKADHGTLAHIFMLVGLMFLFTLFLIFASIEIGEQPRQLSEAQVEQATARIARMSQLHRGAPAQATKVVAAAGPAAIVQNNCALCHASGLAGAPLLTDAAEWAKRLAERGLDGLYQSALKGRGAMPPRAGTILSDEELRVAVEHISQPQP